MNPSAESVRVAHPLFQAEGGGSSPTSALQLHVAPISKLLAVRLNRLWHSRLPVITNWQTCDAFGAEFGGRLFAVALWSPPIARALNGRGWYELRRLSIAPDAPKNTASRMLRIMALLIGRARPGVVRLISYQDTEVHQGTIYRAAGWQPVEMGDSATDWEHRSRIRPRNPAQSNAPKIRWEKEL